MRNLIIAGTLATLASATVAAPIPVRTPVAAFAIVPEKAIARVETMRVDFKAGQAMPEHMHPVPVICFVAQGTFLVSLGSEPVRRVTVGDSTIERAGEIVHFFRNVSATAPAQLYCTILAGKDDKQLSIMLGK